MRNLCRVYTELVPNLCWLVQTIRSLKRSRLKIAPCIMRNCATVIMMIAATTVMDADNSRATIASVGINCRVYSKLCHVKRGRPSSKCDAYEITIVVDVTQQHE